MYCSTTCITCSRMTSPILVAKDLPTAGPPAHVAGLLCHTGMFARQGEQFPGIEKPL